MSRSNIIILTDPSSELPIRRDKVVITPIQGEYSRDKLMLQRIRSYIVRKNALFGIACDCWLKCVFIFFLLFQCACMCLDWGNCKR